MDSGTLTTLHPLHLLVFTYQNSVFYHSDFLLKPSTYRNPEDLESSPIGPLMTVKTESGDPPVTIWSPVGGGKCPGNLSFPRSVLRPSVGHRVLTPLESGTSRTVCTVPSSVPGPLVHRRLNVLSAVLGSDLGVWYVKRETGRRGDGPCPKVGSRRGRRYRQTKGIFEGYLSWSIPTSTSEGGQQIVALTLKRRRRRSD